MMAPDIQKLAVAAVTIVAPFMPFLTETVKAGGKKLVEVIAQKGGESVWEKAQNIWNKITEKCGDAPDIKGAAMMVASQPEDETYQTALVKALSGHLQAHPELVEVLVELFGGGESIQQVLADRGSLVEGIVQQMQGAGTQSVEARELSTIKNVTQSKTG